MRVSPLRGVADVCMLLHAYSGRQGFAGGRRMFPEDFAPLWGADVFDLRRALPGRIGYCRRRNCGAGRTRERGSRANTCGAHPPEPYPHRTVGRRGVSEDSVPESRPAETRWMTGARAMGAAWFGGVTGAFGLCGREPCLPAASTAADRSRVVRG